MSFEEMQAILAGVVSSQAEIQSSQAVFRESQDQIQASHAAFRESLELMRQDIANTQAIANSNARAIEAATNQQAYDREQMNQLKDLQATTQAQLIEFIRFVGMSKLPTVG